MEKGFLMALGGTVKSAADRVVKFGTNICNAHQFGGAGDAN